MTSINASDTRHRNGKTALFTWGPPVLVLLLILVISLTPGSIYPEHPEFYNITVHFLEFAFLAYFLARALAESRAKNTWMILVWTVSLGALVGIMTELLQFTVPHRMFDFMDMLVDIFGAFTGTFLYIKVTKTQTAEGSDRGNLPDIEDV